MTSSTQSITLLHQRMIDDMRMRKLSPKTQNSYIRAVRQFSGFLGRSPETRPQPKIFGACWRKIPASDSSPQRKIVGICFETGHLSNVIIRQVG